MRRIGFVLPLLVACSAPSGNGEDFASTADELSATDPVSAAVSQSCSTTAVKGLSQQLVDEINCLQPGTLTSIASVPNVSLGSAVFPYLQVPAASSLGKAVAARGSTLTVNSALRTLPQQYLLYQWYLQGKCGIGLAAAPGNSNHESGLAVDVDDHTGWQSYFESRGWKWYGSADPVHFDYVAGGVDLRSLSVEAFQKLWNENNPTDTIAEDGAYGPETEKRLTKSPVGGFAKGATCTEPADAGTPPKDAGTPVKEAGADASEPDATTPEPDAGATEPSPASGGCSASGTSGSPNALALALGALALGWSRRKRRLAIETGEC